MADLLESIKNLPDISFIGDLTLADVQTMMINEFQSQYEEITGKKISLGNGDPTRILILTCAQIIYQGLENVDKAGKMNFLKYAEGDYLDNLAAFKNVTRQDPQKATVRTLWKLAEPRESATGIPEGSRITASYDIYFETTEYHEIPVGDTEIEIIMTCTTAGAEGNGYMPGELNTLVDPVAFIVSVENIETSTGGTNEESDESLAERAYLAPSSFSVAGPDDAYMYWAYQFSSEIGDVLVTSPEPGVVDVRFIMADGSLPDQTIIDEMAEHLQQRSKRPLTDYVIVGAPDPVTYNIDLTYYINTSDTDLAATIQTQANQAVQDYVTWQSEQIGRDINPDELISLMRKAGVKRVEVTEPVFTVLPDAALPVLGTSTIRYGGLEDD
ncbi:MAG: baseplate J/gp47 family protein [Bacteroidales bacterium]|nr:baseplate J/gp47 family protein [Bacteroidales bacterium]